MDVTATAGEWEVLLTAPADVGDFGLHQDADVAAAAFRRQFARAFADTPVAEHGAVAEAQFRQARELLVGRPVLWSGFLMLMTPAAAGSPVATLLDGQAGDPEELARLRALAEIPAVFVIQLSVQVGRLAPHVPGAPMSQAASLARALRGRYGEDAGVHQVRYGTVEAVATVRTVEHEVAGTGSFAADSPPVEHLLAEVSLLFPEEEALVTVTAATTHGAALQDAVLLAGSIAGGIRLRPATGAREDAAEQEAVDREVPSGAMAAEPVPSPPGAAEPGGTRVGVLLPGGGWAPAGRTLVGRAPRGAADHVLALDDQSISRTHVVLDVTDGAVAATDLHSTNGTVVRRPDGGLVRLAPGVRTELAEGEELNLGAVVLRVAARGRA